MLSIGSILGIAIILIMYIVFLLYVKKEYREKFKIYLYTFVFFALFFPEVKTLEFPFGIRLNIELYAIMICGIELIEKYTKYIIDIKIRKGKEISKRMKYIYESL